jgi:hypothetical protein
MSNEIPYEKNAQLIDCDKLVSSYSYSLSPACSKNQLSCDNQSYTLYATDKAYQGFYDNCSSVKNGVPQCDLTYVSSSPKLNQECWSQCCDKNMRNCDTQCQLACVINDDQKKPVKKQ